MQKLVDLDPDNVDILYFAQFVYTELADGTLNKLAILAPRSARMQQVIAEHLINGGNLEAAIVHYKKCLDLDPHLLGVRYELAEAMFQARPSDPAVIKQALGELQTSIKVEGDNSKIECELAKIALRQSDRDSALAHYRRAFALNPHDAQAQLGLGHMLMPDHPQEALRYLRMAVESDPLNGEAHYRLAAVYRKLQRPEEAQEETKLFQEIKLVKNQVAGLYREMNKTPPRSISEQDLDAEPQ